MIWLIRNLDWVVLAAGANLALNLWLLKMEYQDDGGLSGQVIEDGPVLFIVKATFYWEGLCLLAMFLVALAFIGYIFYLSSGRMFAKDENNLLRQHDRHDHAPPGEAYAGDSAEEYPVSRV